MSSSAASAGTADGSGTPDSGFRIPDSDAPGAGGRSAPPVGIAIVGPTASGKTALSIDVARRLDAEILSMDSRQVYRGMDVGTAKATAAEQAAAPHHGLDLIDPDERFSAGRFAAYARARIHEIRARGRVPVLVGGTGFFLRALTEPLFEEPRIDAVRRRELERVLRTLDDDALRGWLNALDPATAGTLARGGGRQRMLRALEVALLTGRSIGWWHRHSPATEPAVPLLVVLLELERAELDRRIDARVHAMIEAGLVDEVRTLLDAGVDPEAPGMTATGYREIVEHLSGRASLADAIMQIQLATRQYARRQLTWFRNQLGANVLRLDATRPAGDLGALIVKAWDERSRSAGAPQ